MPLQNNIMRKGRRYVPSLPSEKKERRLAGDDLPVLIAPITLQENH